MPGFSDAQNRVHMGLWAISGAPLLVGADLAKLSTDTLAMLINKEVVAVDQDALGLQAVKVAEAEKGVQVWSKPLAVSGSRAVLLLNRTTTAADVKVEWKDIGLAENPPAGVREIWSGKDAGNSKGSYSARVPAGDAALLLVKGADMRSTGYKPDGERNDVPPCRGCELTFTHVGARGTWARVRISYRNSTQAPRYVELRVNGQDATSIALPPAGSDAGEISIMARLDRPGASNVLTFSADSDLTGVIDAITVE